MKTKVETYEGCKKERGCFRLKKKKSKKSKKSNKGNLNARRESR